MNAIREALLNSFCHKDYASGQSNEVAIYKDCLEIYNQEKEKMSVRMAIGEKNVDYLDSIIFEYEEGKTN